MADNELLTIRVTAFVARKICEAFCEPVPTPGHVVTLLQDYRLKSILTLYCSEPNKFLLDGAQEYESVSRRVAALDRAGYKLTRYQLEY